MSWTLGDLQRENGAWRIRNFPDQQPHHPLLGLVEELGELAEALGEGPPYAAYLDAIADSTIFLVAYCSHNSWPIEPLWERRRSFAMPPRPLPILLGQLARSRLKTEQGVRGGAVIHAVKGQEAAGALLAHFERLANLMGQDYIELVHRIWLDVSQRDWQANPETGAADGA